MKNVFFRIGSILLLAGAVFWLIRDSGRNSEKKVMVGNEEFRVELADTPQKRELGLGGRETLCQGCAMVFVFPESGQYSFWMKGMRFPLDILWWRSKDGRIVHIEKNIPADSRKSYAPSEEADRVLEINGGLADKYGIAVGDKVKN